MGILRGGDGDAFGFAGDVSASAPPALGESGTELASRAPPDAVRNCLRSNAKSLARSFKRLRRNLVRATTGRHYTTGQGRQKQQNRFFNAGKQDFPEQQYGRRNAKTRPPCFNVLRV